MARCKPKPRGGPPALPPDTNIVESLLLLPPEDWPDAIDQFGPVDRDAFDLDWPSWAHEGQEPPDLTPGGAPWRTWVIMAGRGFGKTLAGAKWLTARIAAHDGSAEKLDIALVGATLAEARAVMVEGRSGLLHVADAWVSEWSPSLRRLTFRTGAVATLFSGASPEQLRGPEHHLAWCDELAKWEKPQESWDMLQLGLRLGDWPRAIVTTTPRPGPVLTAIMADAETVTTGGPTAANPHLSPAWQRAIHALYAGTRLGEQELEGKLLPDVPGALWSVELLERCRMSPLPPASSKSVLPPAEPDRSGGPITSNWAGGGPVATSEEPTPQSHLRVKGAPRLSGQARGLTDPEIASGRGGLTPSAHPEKPLSLSKRCLEGPHPFTKVAIAVDPPVMDGTCGIIACARDEAGRAHILADHSVTARTPEGWARAVADAVRIHTLNSSPGNPGEDQPTITPYVVAEKNQGGKMVAAVLRTADPKLKVKLVTATVGKAERAAPVAMLFEAGRVVLHGRFPELEAEMLGMIAGGDYEGPGHSPDRADAMVWGLSELMLGPEPPEPRVRSF